MLHYEEDTVLSIIISADICGGTARHYVRYAVANRTSIVESESMFSNGKVIWNNIRVSARRSAYNVNHRGTGTAGSSEGMTTGRKLNYSDGVLGSRQLL